MRASRRHTGKRITVFVLALLLLAGVLLLRIRTSGEISEPQSTPMVPSTETQAVPATAAPVSTQASAAPTTEPLTFGVQEATESEAETASWTRGYNETTYQLVSDMLYIRRSGSAEGEEEIPALLEQLRAADPEMGALWTGIMEYWSYANTEMPIHREGIPDGLPQDDSLCLVVLGFQLLYDGDMAPELLGRCQVTLAAAQKYPNAFIAVTGGGTAGKDRSITEAGVMADWLIAQGIAPERIIREDASLTTDQNATNTCAILAAMYPQVKQVAVISSDYHLPLGCLMFTEAALLYGYENGEAPYEVVSNAAWATDGKTPGYSGMKNQASYVWVMADPKY